jgi:hypothetical protein
VILLLPAAVLCALYILQTLFKVFFLQSLTNKKNFHKMTLFVPGASGWCLRGVSGLYPTLDECKGERKTVRAVPGYLSYLVRGGHHFIFIFTFTFTLVREGKDKRKISVEARDVLYCSVELTTGRAVECQHYHTD